MVDGKKVHRMGAMGVVANHGGPWGVRGEAGVLWGPLGFGGLWRAVGAIGGCGCGRLWGDLRCSGWLCEALKDFGKLWEVLGSSEKLWEAL